jgi:ankyrin repeat protein
MVKELLEHGADPKLRGSIAVVSAAGAGCITGMLTLIEHGADIHIQEGVPGKALHYAAQCMELDMVKFLLEKGVDVNTFGGEDDEYAL